MSDADLHGFQYDRWYMERQALRQEEEVVSLIRNARVIEQDGRLCVDIDDLIVWVEGFAHEQANAVGFARATPAFALRMVANGLRDLRDGA